MYNKYLTLRPAQIQHNRLFIFYKNGKCTKQLVGLHTLGKIPSKIAIYLKIETLEQYTGHCLRRGSATLLVDGGVSMTKLKRHGGWKTINIAEGYIATPIKNKIENHVKITTSMLLLDHPKP